MDFLWAIFACIVIILIAFMLGKTQHSDHPATHVYSWGGAIIVLLLIRWFL